MAWHCWRWSISVVNHCKIILHNNIKPASQLIQHRYHSHGAATAIKDILQDLGPQFYADKNKIRFIHQPEHFYQELLVSFDVNF